MSRYLDPITLVEQTAPGTPISGDLVLYAKTDAKLYSKDDTGAEFAISVTLGQIMAMGN